jgi:hypothetical protein
MLQIWALFTLVIKRRQKQLFDKKLQEIDSIHSNQHDYAQNLEAQRKLIKDLLIREKISES